MIYLLVSNVNITRFYILITLLTIFEVDIYFWLHIRNWSSVLCSLLPTLQKSTSDFERRTIIKPWSNLIFIHGWTRTIVSLFSLQFTCNEKMTISATKKKEFSNRYGCILNLNSEIMTIKYWVVGGARMRLEWNYIAMNVRIDKTLVTESTCYLLAVFYYVIFYSILSGYKNMNR